MKSTKVSWQKLFVFVNVLVSLSYAGFALAIEPPTAEQPEKYRRDGIGEQKQETKASSDEVNVQKALESLNRAILENPTAEAYFNRGEFYFQLAEYEKAIQDCSNAVKLKPSYKEAHIKIAISYKRMGQYDKAIEEMTQVIRIFPDAGNYMTRANIYEEMNLYDKAIEDYSKAVTLQPDNAQFYNYRGMTYNRCMKQYDKAIQDFNKAVAIKPDYLEAYYERGAVYEISGQTEKAVEDYSKAISCNPKDVYVGFPYLGLGRIYEKLKDFNRACEYYRKACEAGKCDRLNWIKNSGYCK